MYHRRIQQAALKAYRVAVQHLTIPSVCAACVAFTEMLGLDSTALRVDIQAADRLLAHAGLEDLLGDDAKEGNTMQDVIGNFSICVNAIQFGNCVNLDQPLQTKIVVLSSRVDNYLSNASIIHQV